MSAPRCGMPVRSACTHTQPTREAHAFDARSRALTFNIRPPMCASALGAQRANAPRGPSLRGLYWHLMFDKG
eukprot:CAMPEP_0176237776 /NCGR_PEP_ID=MMETSP0121_2-20121125/28023_1 /TAXON_ID=160619 /ORGANISM="Kryptoperidinium foliaceum, Strain CCMP 1326" /LENGTH=71 /DNA_ID=CAMNT_0017577229 /DNA_START=118 /DNA_END=333 /DNA_ORIENTATION=+